MRQVVASYFSDWDDVVDASGTTLIPTHDAVILGHRSYDEWAEFWPTTSGDIVARPATSGAPRSNRVALLSLAVRALPPGGDNSARIAANRTRLRHVPTHDLAGAGVRAAA